AAGLALRIESGSAAEPHASPAVFPQIEISLLSGADLHSGGNAAQASANSPKVARAERAERSFADSGIFGMEQIWRAAPGRQIGRASAGVGRDEALLMDMSLSGIENLLADTRYDNLPDLHKVPGPIPRGVDLPRGDISDRLFLLQTGVFPFVDPQFQSVSPTP